jgi:hypothetical protein
MQYTYNTTDAAPHHPANRFHNANLSLGAHQLTSPAANADQSTLVVMVTGCLHNNNLHHLVMMVVG